MLFVTSQRADSKNRYIFFSTRSEAQHQVRVSVGRSLALVTSRGSHLVADLSGLLGQRVVLVLRLPDVLLVSQSLHVLQLLVRELQLLPVVVVLLHFGLEVTQLLLGEHKAGVRVQPQLPAQLHPETRLISTSDLV